MTSSKAKKLFQGNEEKQNSFDKLMTSEYDSNMSSETNESMVIGLVKDKYSGTKSIPGGSVGGEVEIKKGGDYIKDLL